MDYLASQCGYVSASGEECGYWAVEGSPVNLCRDHLREAHDWASKNLQGLKPIGRQTFHICPECNIRDVVSTHVDGQLECEWCGFSGDIAAFIIDTPYTREPEYPQPTRAEPIVYYVVHGTRIKIGTSRSWVKRLRGIPHDRVLALEPGGPELEAKRHAQFKQYRVGRTEWFEQAPEIWDHIVHVNDARVDYSDIIDRYNRARRTRGWGGAHV